MLKEYHVQQLKGHPCIAYTCDTRTYWHLVDFFGVPDEETKYNGGECPFDPDQDNQSFWVYYSLVIKGGEGIISPNLEMDWGRVFVRSDIDLDLENNEVKWCATGYIRQNWKPFHERTVLEFKTGRTKWQRSLCPKVVTHTIIKRIVKELSQDNEIKQSITNHGG